MILFNNSHSSSYSRICIKLFYSTRIESSSSVNDAHTNVDAIMTTAPPKKSSSSINDAHTNVHAKMMTAAPKRKAKTSE